MAYEVNELSDYEQLMRELPLQDHPRRGEKSLRSEYLPGEPSSLSVSAWLWVCPLRPLDESVPASEGLEHSVIADKLLRAAADQRHQVLQRLPGEGHQGHGRNRAS